MPRIYRVANGAEPTTASFVAVASGTAIKTLLQIAPPSGVQLEIVEWGISFDNTVANTPGICELIETDVAATGGTSLTPTKWSEPNDAAAQSIGGAALTCYSPSGEGTIAAVRSLDTQQLPPTAPYVMQFPLGERPKVVASKFCRVRVKFGTTVNCIAYVKFIEC